MSKQKQRVAIYARVSTTEGKQTPENQLRQLRKYAKARGFTITAEYIDCATGRNERRPQYQKLLDAIRKRQADVVLVWRYDRFARSTKALITAFNEFRTLGVDFISYQENIDTTTPQGEMVFTIMASLAQFESALIGERTKAGMQRAREQGKRIKWLQVLGRAEPPHSLGMERCGKINSLNSVSESWTGIGVVAGFLAGVDMIESSHMKMVESGS